MAACCFFPVFSVLSVSQFSIALGHLPTTWYRYGQMSDSLGSWAVSWEVGRETHHPSQISLYHFVALDLVCPNTSPQHLTEFGSSEVLHECLLNKWVYENKNTASSHVLLAYISSSIHLAIHVFIHSLILAFIQQSNMRFIPWTKYYSKATDTPNRNSFRLMWFQLQTSLGSIKLELSKL